MHVFCLNYRVGFYDILAKRKSLRLEAPEICSLKMTIIWVVTRCGHFYLAKKYMVQYNDRWMRNLKAPSFDPYAIKLLPLYSTNHINVHLF